MRRKVADSRMLPSRQLRRIYLIDIACPRRPRRMVQTVVECRKNLDGVEGWTGHDWPREMEGPGS